MTTQNTRPKNTRTPDFYIHTVVPNGRANRIGARIGVAFYHKKGDGFSIYLDAQPIPLDGKLELVAYSPKS